MTDFIAAYRDYLTEEKHASANTLSSYIRDLTQFHSWLLSVGVTDMRKVKKETINEYLLHMTHSGKSPAVHSIDQVILCLYDAVRRCEEQPGQERGGHEGGEEVSGDPHQPGGRAVFGAAQMRGRKGIP